MGTGTNEDAITAEYSYDRWRRTRSRKLRVGKFFQKEVDNSAKNLEMLLNFYDLTPPEKSRDLLSI